MPCLQALSQVPDLYEKLTASIAPSIWQMDDVKKGILCQLFGAPGKVCNIMHEGLQGNSSVRLWPGHCMLLSRCQPPSRPVC